jgi:hypothetical protein
MVRSTRAIGPKDNNTVRENSITRRKVSAVSVSGKKENASNGCPPIFKK